MTDINDTSLVEVKYKNQTIASLGADGDIKLNCNGKVMGDDVEVIVPAGTEGTPTAEKGLVSNYSITVTPSVTNGAGFINGSTKTGTAVTVAASELVSGSKTKTANGTYNVMNLASLVVNIPTWDGSIVPDPGLYDDNDNLLVSWADSGIDATKNYTSSTYRTDTASPYYVITNNYRDCTKVVIGNDVTSIGNYAFYNCTVLKGIRIGSSVTSIGDYAFYGCNKPTSINIPSSVTSIGERAFYGCMGLTSITIPNGVTSIGTYTFYNCTKLTDLTIPDSVISIGNYAFKSCAKLTEITIPDSVTSIGQEAFSQCFSLTDITIGNDVTSIGASAFRNCSKLTSITFTGTKAQWNAITKGTDWNASTGNYTIHCTDGDLPKA